MYVGQITLAQQQPVEPDTASTAINGLLGALRMNGQICGREYPVAVAPSGYRATVLLPERHALDATHRHRYVQQSLQKLRDIGFTDPDVTVAEDMDGAGACCCEKPSRYILYTTYLSLESPLLCGDCLYPVPLYRLPPTKDDEYYDVICWQSYYQACDTLQMNCTPLERTALRQLCRLDSGLTKNGLSICQHIKDMTKVSVYYYLYPHNARSLRQDKARRCPACQGEWLLPEPWGEFDFRCDRCCLVSNRAYNLR